MTDLYQARTILIIAASFDGTTPLAPNVAPVLNTATGIETLNIGGVVGVLPIAALGAPYAGSFTCVANNTLDPNARVATQHLGVTSSGQPLRPDPAFPQLVLPGGSIVLKGNLTTVEVVLVPLDRPALATLLPEAMANSGPFPTFAFPGITPVVPIPGPAFVLEPQLGAAEMIFVANFGVATPVQLSANLGPDLPVYVENRGAGILTVNAPGGNFVNGVASVAVAPNTSVVFRRVDATNFLAVGV